MKKLLIGLLCFVPLMLIAQSAKLSPYSWNLISSYKHSSEANLENLSKRYLLKSIEKTLYVNAFIYLSDDYNLNELTALNVFIDGDFGDVVTARIPIDNLEAVADLASVKYVEIGMPVYQKMNNSRAKSNADVVQDGTGSGLSRAFTGKGVIVGVVDYGFQYNHINFYNSTGDTLRIKRVWNQNKNGNAPSGFSQGYEYTTQASIETAKYDSSSDDVGHGTHVTGIAAGGDKNNGNTFYGMATEADIAVVSYDISDYSSDNVSIMNGVKYIFDYASSVNKPAVVNMSLGFHTGPHDGSSTFDRLCDAMQGPGKLLVGAAGNEGTNDLHFSETFSSTVNEARTCVYFPYGFYGYYSSLIDVWGDVNQDYNVSVAIVKRSTGAIVSQSTVLNALTNNVVRFSPQQSRDGAAGSISLASGKNSNNNKGNVSIEIDLNSLASGNTVVLIVQSTENGTVHAWADGYYSEFYKNGMTGYKEGDTDYTVGEIGGSGKEIITVGSYITNKRNDIYATLGDRSDFSSKGPTADGRMKPDITAPGQTIASSIPDLSRVVNSADIAKTSVVAGKTYYYGYMDGTSMATPAVTGILALWLEANPNLNPTRIRQILYETAIRDNVTGTVPNNAWGYGKIDALGGILKALQITSTEQLEKMPSAIMAYPNPNKGTFKLLFNRDDSDVQITIYAVNGQIVYTSQLGLVSARQEQEISLGDVANGAYIVKVVGAHNIQETFRLLVSK